jgi:peptidoglycan-associated lipoprotein
MTMRTLTLGLALAGLLLTAGCAGPRGPQAEGPSEPGQPEAQKSQAETTEEAGAQTRERESASGAEARGLAEQGPDSAESLDGEAGEAGPAAEEQAATLPEDKRVHFEFDSARINQEGRDLLRRHAAYLQAHPDKRIVLEGHADERGTREYNLALGERRAKSARKILTVQGVSSERIEVVSYGEEQPLVDESNQAAWAKNRRVTIRYEDGGAD